MAPLRSSRSTRNQDHQVASRNRPGVVDLDPTEGLPVQKWEQILIRVNQDPSSDPVASATLPSGAAATSSAEWASQFNTPQFPWPEKSFASFYSQLPPWNQEMLRRARTGNTNPKLSVWDRKSNSWISAAEAEKRQNPLKSVHLNNLEPNASSKQTAAPDSPAHDDEDDHDDKSDDEIDGDNADDDVGAATTAGLKRRKKYAPEERIMEVKRWVQMPLAVADKTEERKFLADRRPGMPSLYGGIYQNQVFGSMGLNTNGYGFSAANAGYDLGDGGGLGNAGGMLQTNEGVATPVRKNMPPKRKKKKGGPGRKKANPNPAPQTGFNGVQGATAAAQTLDGTAETKLAEDITMADGDNEGSDSGSEGEGSEEGEIDEAGHDAEKQTGNADQPTEPEQENTELQAPAVAPTEPSNEIEPNDIDRAEHETPKALEAPIIIEPEPQPSLGVIDAIMEDQPTLEVSPVTQPELEAAPSTTEPPSISEQPSEVLPHTSESQIEPQPQPELISVPDSRPEPELVQPEQQPIEEHITSPPPLMVPELVPEQPPTPQNENLMPVPVSTSNPIPDVASLDPIPVDPARLPPISTVVAEAMDQPSISAPGLDPTEPSNTAPLLSSATTIPPPLPSAPVPLAIDTTAAAAPVSTPAPALATAQAQETTTTAVPTATTNTDAVPEPTSPDLLGGLEDELNKNMDEEDGEQ